ncbi:hypothetical protein B566_EDAN007811 [Ephemera danica]|nr:hypothetical protein B566_EDAN007811 [Ephemera danica]
MAVVVETTLGDITIDLFTKERPRSKHRFREITFNLGVATACMNFLKLCKIKYYNYNLFHSVQHNFIAQTGDPTGSGHGGESIFGTLHGEHARYYAGEQMPKIKHSRAGLVSMVNCGDNMLGAQFFITLGSELSSLDTEHCVFGEVTEGDDVLLKMNEAICDEAHRPYQDIRITHTVILEDPFDDPPNLTIPDRSPPPTADRLLNGRLAPDEAIDEMQGKSLEEIEELVQEKEAAARATILEIVGDLPDADMAPPENVLFVCKLNPVTNDDDLEIIFSRFGKINSCEVIRDKVTGDSLQYAFIEFAEQKSCEEAYFKMDNVLIDDRRIHVDFSQSVAKVKWRGKGRGVDYLGGKPGEKVETKIDKSISLQANFFIPLYQLFEIVLVNETEDPQTAKSSNSLKKLNKIPAFKEMTNVVVPEITAEKNLAGVTRAGERKIREVGIVVGTGLREVPSNGTGAGIEMAVTVEPETVTVRQETETGVTADIGTGKGASVDIRTEKEAIVDIRTEKGATVDIETGKGATAGIKTEMVTAV